MEMSLVCQEKSRLLMDMIVHGHGQSVHKYWSICMDIVDVFMDIGQSEQQWVKSLLSQYPSTLPCFHAHFDNVRGHFDQCLCTL